MNISIITPFYNGNQYLEQLLSSVDAACAHFSGSVELILVNDSPAMEIRTTYKINNFKLKIIKNKANCGIHQSRINGVRSAHGEYIIFLDQDDIITENCLTSQYQTAEEAISDMAIGNGYMEDATQQRHLIFKNRSSQNFATHEKPYILARDFIVSPGQCIIRKQSIPQEWLQKGLPKNGADDYLLWLLMFDNGAKINTNYQPIYVHHFTGNNYSNNAEKMHLSQQSMLHFLENCGYSTKKLRKLKRQINFKNHYKKQPFSYTVRYPLIFLYNIYYRLRWKGYTC